MGVYYSDDLVTLHHGDALSVMRSLPDASVDCCVTSPPYFGLRDYGTEGQYGLEASPAEYVETMRALFSEVRRVLADDGTLWLNIGDSYSSGARTSYADTGKSSGRIGSARTPSQLPSKNLLGIPWRVAFALQDDGWILRNDIIWAKPNAMPESVTDRLSTKHEHLFMLTKAAWFGNSTLDLADVDAAWLAALIDGEGTITIGRNRRSESNPAHHDVFSASVSIANTSLPLLEKAGRLMGGANPARNNVGVNRPVYAVQVSGNKAAEVIAAVKPWLIDKATQADIVLALQDTQRSAGVDKRAYQSSEGRAYKERLWEAVRAANRRETQDLSWVRPARRGRWSPRPYWFDLDPIREEVVYPPGSPALSWARDSKEADVPGQSMRQHRSARTHGKAESAALAPTGRRHDAQNQRGKNPGDVWTIATQPFPGSHFAVMPIELARRAILAGCKPGGTVLDPFSGSGTTGLAAQRTGRKYVGIDLNADYLDLSLRTRLQQAALDLTEETA